VWSGVTTAFKCRSGTARRAIAAAIALLVAACSTQSSRRQADFEALRHALPGIYANATDAGASNGGASSAVRLTITPVIAQTIGDPVYFVRESPVGNERLVLAERIWTLVLDPQGRLVQQMFAFKDPRHWLGAAEHRDLLLGLLPQDLTLFVGCELIWQRSTSGFATEALRTPDPCEPGSSVQGQWVERELKLEGSQLALSERQVGSDGALSDAAGSTALTLQRHASSSTTSGSRRLAP
jgi:CpeT/CpcT family protein DUF1001